LPTGIRRFRVSRILPPLPLPPQEILVAESPVRFDYSLIQRCASFAAFRRRLFFGSDCASIQSKKMTL
jgi:hypothetical protein